MKGTLLNVLLLGLGFALTSPAALARAADDEDRGECIASYCPDDAIYQFAPSAAFAASLFEGPTRFSDVLRLGDFGLGGVSPLEGEVIIVDGTAYHASPTGELEILPPSAHTPFVFVKHFRRDRRVELPAVQSLDDLSRALDAVLSSRNIFYAARIEGDLDFIQLRSVQRQTRPYPPLADVVRDQNVFEATKIRGTLVGFRFPAYLSGVNAIGWHFHFVDEARRLGGHVLDVRTGPLPAELDQTRSLTLVLPDDAAFDATDFSGADEAAAAFRDAVRPEDVPRGTPEPEPSPTPSPTPLPTESADS